MHRTILAGSALFASSLASIVTPSVDAADPTITPGPDYELFRKQNDARYMGTSAFDNPDASSWSVCNTAYLYENDRDSSPETNVNCGPSNYNWSYYRSQPADAKTTSTRTQPRSSTVTPTDGAGADPASTVIPEVPEKKKKKSSKAWIAGVVVGPILGLALIGFLAWFCIRKKKSKKAATPLPPATYNSQPAAPAGPTSPPQYYPPPMQQQGAGMAPFGVADGKQNTWAPQPQSPVSQASSPNPLNMYGNQYPQQGGHAGPGQPVYNAPSPSMSPPPQVAYAENNANYQQAHEARPFSSELDGSPQVVNAQPKPN
ncbi:hypothetical protein N0V86_008574 [Didymella sp. IMI 355093]|nr:hypothetical protein N0V86_008574 [Didymella sp. IMI 355093]